MIAILQRVSASSVTVEGEVVGSIGMGLNILLGVVNGDGEAEAQKLLQKILNLRIFADDGGKMNRSLLDVEGEMLVISQFTLAASVKKGRRPSFDNAAAPQEAQRLYEYFCSEASGQCRVATGRFGANMQVAIENDGPVTIIMDTKEL